MCVGDEFLAGENDAAEHPALPVDVLGRGIDDAIGAELQRVLQQRRGEHVVDDQRRAVLVHDLGDGGDVDDLERRIGRRFRERPSWCSGARAARHASRSRALDQRRGDAEARQQFLDDIEARAEQRPGRDDVIAGLELAHQRGGDRRHAARGGARRLGAFEQRHAALEHRHRRIGEARIDEARLVALEARLGLLHRVVEIALGEEQGFRRLFEPRAQRAAVDELRRGPQGLGVAGLARGRHDLSSRGGGAAGRRNRAICLKAPIF